MSLLTANQAAAELGVSARHVYDLARSGRSGRNPRTRRLQPQVLPDRAEKAFHFFKLGVEQRDKRALGLRELLLEGLALGDESLRRGGRVLVDLGDRGLDGFA